MSQSYTERYRSTVDMISRLLTFSITGEKRLIRTRLIRSSTEFEVTVKYFSIIFLTFHV